MSTFKALDPLTHSYQLTMTMPLKEWIELRDQLCNGKTYAAWPGSNVVREIGDMVSQAQRTYFPKLPAPESSEDM